MCCLVYGHLERHVLAPLALPGAPNYQADEPSANTLPTPTTTTTTTTTSSSTATTATTTTTTTTTTNDVEPEASSSDDRGKRPYVGLLLRMIDDFFYVTSDEAAACRFVNAMLDGRPDYGCRANPDKVQLSFELRARDTNNDAAARTYAASDKPLAWCGLLFDAATMGNLLYSFHNNIFLLFFVYTKSTHTPTETSPDYARYGRAAVSDSLTVERSSHAGWSIERKAKHALKMRLHCLLFDENLQSAFRTRLNLYGAFALAYIKYVVVVSCVYCEDDGFYAHFFFAFLSNVFVVDSMRMSVR